MAKQYNSSLSNICSYSFPGSHLLITQLVRTIPNNEKTASSPKAQYFFMLTLAPGEKVDSNYGGGGNDSGRTYKFDKSLNIKYSIHEMISLGFVMKRFAFGQSQVIGNYVKFSKSSTGTKRVTVWESSKLEKGPKGDYTKRSVNMTLSSNENYTFNFSPEDANSFGEIVESLAKKALELEMSRQQGNTSSNNQVIYENKPAEFNNTSSPFSNVEEDSSSNSNSSVTDKFSNMITELPWE